jgi:hypothetical protein
VMIRLIGRPSSPFRQTGMPGLEGTGVVPRNVEKGGAALLALSL